MAVKKSETDMNHVDQKVFKMAAMLDTTIRFHADSVQLDEKELTYADTWLRKSEILFSLQSSPPLQEPGILRMLRVLKLKVQQKLHNESSLSRMV